MVMVKKANGKWKMCVDFTNLNKACPNESFPLSRIDLLVDSTTGHKLLSFRDAFSGYNQIRMSPIKKRPPSSLTGALLLQGHAFWAQERRNYLLEFGKYDVQATNM